MFNLILKIMIAIVIILAIVGFIKIVIVGVVADQKAEYKIYGRKNESYDQFCKRYYIRYI
jgi:hypothetical protein